MPNRFDSQVWRKIPFCGSKKNRNKQQKTEINMQFETEKKECEPNQRNWTTERNRFGYEIIWNCLNDFQASHWNSYLLCVLFLVNLFIFGFLCVWMWWKCVLDRLRILIFNSRFQNGGAIYFWIFFVVEFSHHGN